MGVTHKTIFRIKMRKPSPWGEGDQFANWSGVGKSVSNPHLSHLAVTAPPQGGALKVTWLIQKLPAISSQAAFSVLWYSSE